MKLASESQPGLWQPVPASLDVVLSRLGALSMAPTFLGQQRLAMSRALRPYVEGGGLAPSPEETELAALWLYSDFYPEDGQLSLIEQLRDVITEHIPQDERQWLDPLKHSYMDLVEVSKAELTGERVTLTLRSLGDGRTIVVDGDQALRQVPVGHVLMARFIPPPTLQDARPWVLARCALVWSPAEARELFDAVQEYRRAMEAQSGSFGLGEWGEFAKRYGHLLFWTVAQARFDALVDAVAHIRYVGPRGEPFLFAVALYEHHEFRFLGDGMGDIKGFDPLPVEAAEGGGTSVPGAASVGSRVWVFRTPSLVARLTLTPVQLLVECDSAERLETVKHDLASTFGYSLRFRKEAIAPPIRRLTVEELKREDCHITVTSDEQREMWRAFSEAVYADWADTASPSLGGQTPRHAAANPSTRRQVEALIAHIERDDPGRARTGVASFDYNRLRSHIGLSETSS